MPSEDGEQKKEKWQNVDMLYSQEKNFETV